MLNKYIQRLTENDIKSLALKYDINLSNEELKYIKNLTNICNKDYEAILIKLKDGITPSNYNKIKNLYIKYKDKLP